jgi:predicted RNA-binding Zn-ribbon protein involved in translation (DUF1610 family)
VPRKQKIDLAAVRACLDTVCTKCGYAVPPGEVHRVDFDKMICPACGETFIPHRRTIERQ